MFYLYSIVSNKWIKTKKKFFKIGINFVHVSVGVWGGSQMFLFIQTFVAR